jgi:hypothetical protein
MNKSREEMNRSKEMISSQSESLQGHQAREKRQIGSLVYDQEVNEGKSPSAEQDETLYLS